MDKKLAIVIPVFNNWTYTKRAITDLLKLPEDHTIFIVDNGSADDTKNITEKGYNGRVVVKRNSENLGFARACNIGYSSAKNLGYENVMFLNNDIGVFGNPTCWTDPLISSARRGNIAGPTVGCLDKNLNFICESNKWPTNGYGYLSGWNITAAIATWDKLVIDNNLGPFSIEFVTYFEDTDLGFRAKILGITCEVIPVPVRHIGKVTSKKVGISSLYLHAKPIFIKKWKGKV